MSDMRKVLFVCLGNICRSPIAEGVFRKIVKDKNIVEQWEIDSAAIADWYVGQQPNWRALLTMKHHNVKYNNRSRQVMLHNNVKITIDDYYHYDYILCMDEYNIQDLSKAAPPGSRAEIHLFGEFDPQGERIIKDPYFDDNAEGYEKCYQQSVRCSKGFLEYIDNM